MRILQITEPGKIKIGEKKKPEIGEDEVMLRINYVGFCGSDLNTYLGRNPMVNMPVIPGHEISATVEEMGKDVPAYIRKGMSVTVNPYSNCGQCSSCRNLRVNACEHNQTLGVQRNGAMGSFLAVPANKVIPAEGIETRAIALIEPMSVGFHAVARGEITDTDTVMVMGCGMVGMGAIVRASLRGATVIAVDLDDEKLEIAKSMGAHHTINSKTENLHDRLKEITQGLGPDVVIEAVGSPVTYVAAVEAVAFTGRVVCIGYAKSEIAFQTKLFVQKELDIRGSRNAMPKDFEAVIRYLQRGDCPVDKLISKVVSLEDAATAMEEWAHNPGRVFRILVKFD